MFLKENNFDEYGNFKLNENYKEILKLDNMLTEAKIPHILQRLYDGWQIIYTGGQSVNRNWIMDAIEHFGSYGHDFDQLEIMGLLTPEELKSDGVLGHLSAEDIFERIKKHWSEQNA